jgi:hypothetical protein
MASSQVIDLSGRRFGKLVVQPEHENRTVSGRTAMYWRCICDCGTELWLPRKKLTSGHRQSCKCQWGTPLEYGEADFNARWKDYRTSATKRGIKWMLTQEEFRAVGIQPCHYCGEAAVERKPSKKFNGGFVFNGIDRIDSSGPYQRDNCVSCCTRCNRMKSDLSYEEFVSTCKKVAERFAINNASQSNS